MKSNSIGFQEIDQQVDRFKQRLREQPTYRIADFFSESSLVPTDELFRSLLHIELEHHGCLAEEQSYQKRWPQFSKVIAEMADERRRQLAAGAGGQVTATFFSSTPAPDIHLALPASIGPYAIVSVLGKGGMGVVYKAAHRKTNLEFAIKLIIPQRASTQALQIFLREASILTSLRHSRIVTSHEFGLHDSQPYFVMEYIPSVDLGEILQTQPVRRRIRVVAKTICKVLEGLQFAHEQGVVHRDVKPSNILVFWTGKKLNCKLADFGLAKRFADAGMSGVTGENETRGTLAYMPPEQLQDSRSVGPLADIYSAGVCLFRLLTGSLPYDDTSGQALVRCVLRNEVKLLREFVPDCPPELQQIVTRAMQPHPKDRYPSAGDMLTALSSFVEQCT